MSYMFLSPVHLKTVKIRGREGCGENRDTKLPGHPYFYHQMLVYTQSFALGRTLTEDKPLRADVSMRAMHTQSPTGLGCAHQHWIFHQQLTVCSVCNLTVFAQHLKIWYKGEIWGIKEVTNAAKCSFLQITAYFRSCCCSPCWRAISSLSGHCSVCPTGCIQGSDPAPTSSVVIIRRDTWQVYKLPCSKLETYLNSQAASGVHQGLVWGRLRSWMWIMCDSNAPWFQQCLHHGRRESSMWERDVGCGGNTAVLCLAGLAIASPLSGVNSTLLAVHRKLLHHFYAALSTDSTGQADRCCSG